MWITRRTIDLMFSCFSNLYWELYSLYLVKQHWLIVANHRKINSVFTKLKNPLSSISGYTKHNDESVILTDQERLNGCRLGIDTHADTSCAGKHVRILEYIDGATYNVAPFHGSYKPIQEISMVNGAVAVDTKEGKSYILELNNFLNFTDSMDHSLLCPMQARTNGVIINDIPRNLCPDEADSQCIHFPVEKVRIPIEFHGPIPYLPIRYPSDFDINDFQWLTLTDPSKWSPYGSIGEDLHGDGWDCDIDYTISSMCQQVLKKRCHF